MRHEMESRSHVLGCTSRYHVISTRLKSTFKRRILILPRYLFKPFIAQAIAREFKIMLVGICLPSGNLPRPATPKLLMAGMPKTPRKPITRHSHYLTATIQDNNQHGKMEAETRYLQEHLLLVSADIEWRGHQ